MSTWNDKGCNNKIKALKAPDDMIKPEEEKTCQTGRYR
jgi:hypothetical protein